MIFDSKQKRLQKAIAQGETAKIKSLAQKVDLDKSDTGTTPLVLASALGQLSAVKTLLSCGAGVNVGSDTGETPLMAAARHGQGPVMETLIEAGAKVDSADSSGMTPLILATVWATRMASIGKAKTVERLKLLLDAGADVNTTDRKGRTALITHVRSGGGALRESDRLPVLKYLLEAGSDVNASGDRGRTPLMAAAFRGLKETFELLLAGGASPTLLDNNGRNALMHAASGAFWTYRKAGYIGIFNILIDLGIDLQQKDSGGNTALMIATRSKCRDLQNMLKKAGAFE